MENDLAETLPVCTDYRQLGHELARLYAERAKAQGWKVGTVRWAEGQLNWWMGAYHALQLSGAPLQLGEMMFLAMSVGRDMSDFFKEEAKDVRTETH